MSHPLGFADISIFSPEIRKFRCIKKYRYRLDFDTISNLFNFSWGVNNCLNKDGYDFDDVAKMATPGLLKIRVFRNKGYDVIISVHDVTKNFLSRD